MSLNPSELARELDDELDGPDTAIAEGADRHTPPDDLPDLGEALKTAGRWERAERDRLTILAVAAERKAEIDQWTERRLVSVLARLAWHGHALEGFARRVIGNRVKNKYEDVGPLRLALRQAHRPKVDVRDEAAFIEWVLDTDAAHNKELGVDEHDCALTYLTLVPEVVHPAHYEVNTAAVLDHLGKSPTAIPIGDSQEREFVSDGEVIPGVVLIEQQRDKFDIKPTKGAATDSAAPTEGSTN